MKKRGIGLAILSLLVFAVVATAGDEMMTGYVLKLEKEFVMVEDSETGKEIKVKFDKKTRMIGKLEEDVFVEVETKSGRTVSIKVIEGEEGLEVEDEEKSEENAGDKKNVEGKDKKKVEEKEE